MSQLADIHNQLSLRVCGLEGLAQTMCIVNGDEGLISFFKVEVLLENELGAMRSLVDRLELLAHERGEK